MKKANQFLAGFLGAALALVALAGPAVAQTSGNQRFIVVGGGTGNPTVRVIAVGPITAVGVLEETEDEDIVRFVFPQGTLTLDAPSEEESEEFNERACTGSFTFSGPFQIIGATGAYAGTTGSGTFEGQGRFVGERTATGCSEDEDSGFFFILVNVRGNVTLGGQAAA